LRANDMARIRRFDDATPGRASFTTWLVVVVRHLAVDWIRARDGRPRPQIPDELTPTGRRIYRRLFVEGLSHREAMEREAAESGGALHPGAWLHELREVHRVAFIAGTRQLQRMRVSSVSIAIADEQGAEEVYVSDAHRVLGEALQSLEPTVRLAVQLFVIDEVSAADIAKTVGWPSAKTVYNRVYRALAGIRQALVDRGIGAGDL
jgi:RNA polymerase sigma factor (sigma-70 family)